MWIVLIVAKTESAFLTTEMRRPTQAQWGYISASARPGATKRLECADCGWCAPSESLVSCGRGWG